MKGINKVMIDAAFDEALALAGIPLGSRSSRHTLAIHFFERGKILLQLCLDKVPQKEIELSTLLGMGMVGLRFTTRHIENIFRTIHSAFMTQTGLENPTRISLQLYHSKAAHCPCVGVMQDEKALKVMMISDIIEAVELESEQLN